jgi:hypothetical protein
VLLFGSGMPRPAELMDPELRRIDGLLDDDQLVDHVVSVLRRRWPNSASKGRAVGVTGNLAYRHFCSSIASCRSPSRQPRLTGAGCA